MEDESPTKRGRPQKQFKSSLPPASAESSVLDDFDPRASRQYIYRTLAIQTLAGVRSQRSASYRDPSIADAFARISARSNTVSLSYSANPPSARCICPVVNALSSDAR
jgi:hypothetical protein